MKGSADIFRTSRVIRQPGLFGSRSGTAVIQPERADAAIGELTGDPYHVAAVVTPRETVHQDGERAAGTPAGRTVIVQDEHIAVGEFDDVLSRGIPPLFARQKVAQQRLPMPATGEQQRTQRSFDRMIHDGDFRLTAGLEWLE